MRGTPRPYPAIHGKTGIIPAYAGNTIVKSIPTKRWWDHPRICGEHRHGTKPIQGILGSSPHMRGTQQEVIEMRKQNGIIPAYAGNTGSVTQWIRRTADHPRICGEHTPSPPLMYPLPGSSPHMRGTPNLDTVHLLASGIIPAYAGNTSQVGVLYGHSWDHPRICGEHFAPFLADRQVEGSSPHMRGTLRFVLLILFALRIIPAYAGNTQLRLLRRP